MKIKKERLFDIGTRYTIELDNGVVLEIISFFKGNKSIYIIKNDRITDSFNLTEEEAKEIGLILADLYDLEEETIPLIRDKVIMEWLKIKEDFYGANKKIKELKVRTRTNASIVAIERNNKVISNVGPESKILPGDKILIVGSIKSVDKAKALLVNGFKGDNK